ncbi:MAG: hypothetical protein GXX96_28865 [Planctomycetaceae bacterium]|nr:hypothetical protein [Planctomycetaceae bacterium]
MSSNRRQKVVAILIVLLMGQTLPTRAQEPYAIPLRNPSFAEGVDQHGVPLEWSRYGSGGEEQKLQVTREDDGHASLLIADGDRSTEIGVTQTVALKGGDTYRAAVKVRGVEGASSSGAYLQLRFLPSNQYAQTGLATESAGRYSEVSVVATAPPDTTQATLYLYTHREPRLQIVVTDVRLTGGHPAPPPPPPPPPAPVPPQYETLKDLHVEIPLVQEGKVCAALVVPASSLYRAAAEKIQRTIQERTGVLLPIVNDDSAQAGVPLQQNLIVLGNRSTNKTVNSLYDHYYCLVDLKYPGPEGFVVRTVHNPYGNGNSVVVVGGSDPIGVDRGAESLARVLASAASGNGRLAIGWTMETQLGKGVAVPTDIRQFETWEASRGYGSIGYFGWCSISKQMAMYYMTGNEACAREVVRLAFPDAQAIRDIEETDGERIENKHDPLAGFYHYNAHMAILFWDLIEESPAFSDEERLNITNAFARQLNHRKGEGIYGLTRPPRSVGSRHGQWSAVSLYCLGRYFDKDYPNPIWAQCVRGGQLAFGSLHEHAWIAGESDNLFWYSTGIAPIFTYMTLSGDRRPLENGVVTQLLRGQEMLVSGRAGDWALNSASIGMLNKAAYLTGDGRWSYYRDRTGVDTGIFRLGQSFWPGETVAPQPPTDLVGKWSVNRLPEPAWAARDSGLPLEQSFYFGSYRSAVDASGDYILLDGFNGASRNPYHTFDILQLRLGGQTVLDGYHNQVLTSADGMVEPAVAMNAALVHADVVGSTATAVGEVPGMAFCNWRRMLAQRTGRYALVVDDLTFRADSQNMSVTTSWQAPGGRWDAAGQRIRAAGVELRSCDVQHARGSGAVTLEWNGAVKEQQHRLAFYLIAPAATDGAGSPACLRVAENAAAVALPQPALAIAGEYRGTAAELAVLAEDHLYGRGLTSAGIDGELVASDRPIDIDWDFATGTAHVVVAQPTRLRLSVAEPSALRVDGKPVAVEQANAAAVLSLPAGRHVITGAPVAPDRLAGLSDALRQVLKAGLEERAGQLAAAGKTGELPSVERRVAFSYQAGGRIADMVGLESFGDARLAVAVGKSVHLLAAGGDLVRKLETDGDIRVLHWWPEPGLLLAGCVDEKVIAFDAGGERKWTFTSEMDPAVYEAAKTYWFKSAPGHEGIHGLYTGAFDEGKNRCFVGSACTLEILDENGSLVKRTPTFWGPGRKFLLVDAADGSRNLLISRWPNGTDELSLVGSRSMSVTGRGYYGVPAGHSFVGGWSAQNRTGLFLDDLNGDGDLEVATAVNGTWNRVTVYSLSGKALHNAQFGPGAGTALRSRMRDMDVADLNGDGKREILVGLSEGLVVCLDHACGKVWSTRLASPPLSIQCVVDGTSARGIVVGCDDGTVVGLDSGGTPVRIGRVTGRPTHRQVLSNEAGPVVVLGTDKGEVLGLGKAGNTDRH